MLSTNPNAAELHRTQTEEKIVLESTQTQGSLRACGFGVWGPNRRGKR